MTAEQIQSLRRELELERGLALHRARTSFLGYCQLVGGVTWVPNFHHVATCEAVQHALDGKTPRQLLQRFGHSADQIKAMQNTPHSVTGLYGGMTNPAMIDEPVSGIQAHYGPRHGKSQIISRFLPPYYLGRNPTKHVICASHTQPLAEEMGEDVQAILDGEAHLRAFPDVRIANPMIEQGTRTKKRFSIAGHRGSYRGAGVGGNVVGRSGHLIDLDDLVKGRKSAESEAEQKTVSDFYRGDIYTRREKDTVICLVNTRWSQKDISGVTLAAARADADAQQWFCLVFPSILDCEPGPADTRKQGQALWPEKMPLKELHKIKKTMGSYEFEAQHQQRPISRVSALIKSDWWKFYDVLPSSCAQYTISVDLSFSNRGDFNVFSVWASLGAQRYLVDQVRGRYEFNEQLRVFATLCGKYPQARTKLVEEAANGAALINTLKNRIQGILPIKPKTSKELRVQAVSPQIEAGNVFLPTPARAPWIDDFILEFEAFPAGAFDDQIDACCQYLLHAEQQQADYSKLRGISLTRTSPVERHR